MFETTPSIRRSLAIVQPMGFRQFPNSEREIDRTDLWFASPEIPGRGVGRVLDVVARQVEVHHPTVLPNGRIARPRFPITSTRVNYYNSANVSGHTSFGASVCGCVCDWMR